MKLASERNAFPDGSLVVVSRDLKRMESAAAIAPNLQNALERWEEVSPALRSMYDRLNTGRAEKATEFRPEAMAAPLPRAWQWLDGSAFPSHGELMQKAFNLPPIATDLPLMYQGMSHQFLGPTESVPFITEQDDIDFEGEFGVITGEVPMGPSVGEVLGRIRLAVQINDWSLRAIAPVEMKTGFGWIQAKPACSMAPVAVTLDELGDDWAEGRILATLDVRRSGAQFGSVPSTGDGLRVSPTHRACGAIAQTVRRHHHWLGHGLYAFISRGGLLLYRGAQGHRDDRFRGAAYQLP